MKKMLRSIISCICVCALLTVPIINTAFAASSVNRPAKVTESIVQKDVDNEIELARKEIYRQLEEQDALILMDVYESIIYPQIEEQVRAEYGQKNSIQAAANKSYYAPNGGMVTYLTPISGYKPTEVAVTCYNRNDSYTFLLERLSFSMKDLLLSIVGYIPKLGAVSSPVLDIKGVMDSITIGRIKDADGCAQIMNTYSREWGTKASLVMGWTSRYNITVPSNATNISFTKF